MKRIAFPLIIAAAFFLIQSCVTPKKVPMRSDPLIGKIIDSKKSTSISFDGLLKSIHTNDVIYLSEKHDNPDIHTAQEKIIQALVDMDKTPTIGFEFFSMDQTPDLLNFIDSGNVKHSDKNKQFIENDLRRKLRWDTQSDKMWSYYYNLLTLAKKNKLPVAGIDLGSTLKKRITRKTIKGLTPLEAENIFSTSLENDAYKEYMFSIFKAVHCGMGHGKMQEKLYDTWVARNDKMAHSVTRLAAHANGPVVIIIGGGHTEYGLGVIDRVSAINKEISQVNVALREISTGPSDLAHYLEPLELKGFDAVPPSDYTWFFQRVSYDDPCEAFKASLKKMKQSKNQ